MAQLNWVITLLVILHLTSVVYTNADSDSDSVHGCGGFIQASSPLIKSRKPSDSKLDYSHVSVHLETLDGLLKDKTQCAPNGYYFIPVYDKGSFIIKVNGPRGWSWDPPMVPVLVDHTGCNANQDINFHFTGFSLSGRVLGAVAGDSCRFKNGGPSNVSVQLLSSADDLVSSVFTSSTGEYFFKNVTPGKYKLRASHHDMTVKTRGPTEVELGFGDLVVGDIFSVAGYVIHGHVVAQGNPILGVHIYLHSDDVMEVDCPQGAGHGPGERKALCHTVSDADGKFIFKSIPCGIYELVPWYKGENTVFDVSPSSVTVAVKHSHVTVPQKFQVTGFSIGGRVVDGNGAGVSGAQVLVDGLERSVTDESGYYKIDQVTSKRYAIEARKRHYNFEVLGDILVLPNMASIPEIKAVSYDVCGVVRMAVAGYKAKVALTHGPDNVKPQIKQADTNGAFCFQVPPGDYRLSALASTTENALELIFLPPQYDISVKSPLLNIEFSQAQVNIHGKVVCKDKCDSSVSITLVRLGSNGNIERTTVGLTERDEFTFPKVFPGKYRLEAKHSPTDAGLKEDGWCWEQSSIEVYVGMEDLEGILFTQKGYWVDIISSHDVDAHMIQPDSEPVFLKIKKGSQRLCVESPGVHEVKFVDSCIFFGSASFNIDTAKPVPVNLSGMKYLVKGQIHVDSTSVNLHELPESIVVDVLDEDVAVDGVIARLASTLDDVTNAAVFEYSLWANRGQKLTFIPRDSRTLSSNTAWSRDAVKKIMFYPRQLQILVTDDGCQGQVPTFTGRRGLYIEGSVSPPISGVNIKIIAAGDSHHAPLKKGDLALETSTGPGGVFVGGPLYDDISYTTEALKTGYHLKAVGRNSFSCQKLGQISVRIYSKEDTEEPFPSVLLSLSGENGYRNNSKSRVGGHFIFEELFPGSFYLRPLLKEYAFSPPTQAIELGSGEAREVVFEATRVAYSAMGVVTLLAGQPKEGITIEARAESEGYYEETTSDSSGFYRLRGLLPDITYLIKVVSKKELDGRGIERASPDSVSVKVGATDNKGLDFVVFEEADRSMVSCHVEGERSSNLDSHLWVEIRSASDPSKVKSSFPLPLSHFFQVKDLPKGKHFLQLRSGIPSSAQKFLSDIIEIDLEKHTRIHVGPLRYRVEEHTHTQELTVGSIFPLVAGVSVILLFISMPRLKDLASGMVMSGTAKKEVRKPLIRKKTY